MTEEKTQEVASVLCVEEKYSYSPHIITDSQELIEWRDIVKKSASFVCQHCFTKDVPLCAFPVIPFENGGKYTEENGMTLCRPCLLITVDRLSQDDDKKSIDISISFRLRDKLEEMIIGNWNSISSFTRTLMNKYNAYLDVFTDISQYQDESTESRLHLTVNKKQYEIFQANAIHQNKSIRDLIVGLYLGFELESFHKIPVSKNTGDI